MQKEDAEKRLGKAKTHAGPGSVQVTVDVINQARGGIGLARFKRILEAKD